MTLDQWLNETWPRFLEALVVASAMVLLLRLTRNWLGRALNRGRVERGTQILVMRSVSIGIVVVGLVVVLGIVGVQPAALVTIVGAVGLALSLAVQDILKNFFSGIYLLLERPFRVGDVIKVKDQGGSVEHIGVRTTTLRTPENVLVLVPNAIVFAEIVSNQTYARPAVPPEAQTGEAATGATAPGEGQPASGPR